MKTIPQPTNLSTTIDCSTPNSGEGPIADHIGKISVSQSGLVRFNGEKVNIEQLREKLSALKLQDGVVWYYREFFGEQAPAISSQIIQLVIETNLNVSFSTKPDFSTVILPNGTVRRRHDC